MSVCIRRLIRNKQQRIKQYLKLKSVYYLRHALERVRHIEYLFDFFTSLLLFRNNFYWFCSMVCFKTVFCNTSITYNFYTLFSPYVIRCEICLVRLAAAIVIFFTCKNLCYGAPKLVLLKQWRGFLAVCC